VKRRSSIWTDNNWHTINSVWTSKPRGFRTWRFGQGMWTGRRRYQPPRFGFRFRIEQQFGPMRTMKRHAGRWVEH